MTLLEIQAWIASATLVDTPMSQYNPDGDLEMENIYNKNGEFFRLGFCNGKPYLHVSETGVVIPMDYKDPTPVRSACRMIFERQWVE